MEEMKIGKQLKKGKPEKPINKSPAPSRRIPQGDVIFALDIGTHSVIGVLARKTDQGCRIIDIEKLVHEQRSMTDGQIEDIHAVANDIKRVKNELENRRGITLSGACIAAAGRALKTLRSTSEYKLDKNKMITADDMKSAELDAVRRTYEAFSQNNDSQAFYCVGHSVISLVLDGFKVLKPEGHRGETLITDLIAAFLPAYVVESLCSAVDEAGLEVQGLTLEPIAAMNVIVPGDLRLINCALCDIGAGTSDVAIARDGSVVAYSMATSAGDEISESIMRELLVDFNTAEQIKTSQDSEITYTDILLKTNKVPRERISKTIAPAMEDLAKTIADEIIESNLTPPQAVFLVGGGSKLVGLPEMVAKELGIDSNRVIAGRRELFRGVIAPDSMPLDAEDATPLGIAVSAGEGVSYDFTTVTVNGKRLRALDTNRLTVFELMSFAKLKPEDMLAGTGKPLSFTLSGNKVTLRGLPPKPSEIRVNGESASLNTVVNKGDSVKIIPAKAGADAQAKLSEHFDLNSIKSYTVTVFGKKQRAGRFISVNGKAVTSDRNIMDGDDIRLVETETLGKLLKALNITEGVLLNDVPAAPDTPLKSGDVITPENFSTAPIFDAAPEPDIPAPAPQPAPKPEISSVQSETHASVREEPSITINGIKTAFPLRSDGKPPIFLDVAAAFSDDPTMLLANSDTITVNGKIARLDEEIHSGDVIVIE